MKKLLSIILILAVLASAGCAYAKSPGLRFTTYGSTAGAEDILPEGDAFALDLYMSPDTLKASIIMMTWRDGIITTDIKYADVKSLKGDNKTLYFVFDDKSYYTGHYDENDRWRFWLDLPDGSVRLQMVDEFNCILDVG